MSVQPLYYFKLVYCSQVCVALEYALIILNESFWALHANVQTPVTCVLELASIGSLGFGSTDFLIAQISLELVGF